MLWLSSTSRNKSFFHMSTMKLHHLNNLRAAQGKNICGSSAGWLIMVDKTSQIISLIKPCNAAKIIQLEPSFCTKTEQPFLVHKAILSSDPELDPFNFSVLAISGDKRQLAYYDARSQTWTLVHAAGPSYDDIISHQGKFYAVDEYGKICQIDHSNWSVQVVFDRWFFGGNKVYLVCIDGQFLVIFRYLKENPYFGYETYNFQVFMLNLEEQKYSSIGKFPEFAIFLGQNHSTWLPADDTKGVIGDSIYFTDDHHSNGLDCHDAGLYDMEYSRVVPLQCCNHHHLRHVCSRPIWFMSDNIDCY
ncbi:hypothetical protein Ddye_009222 [Dipteronia dyeriana]|uniref:KIB1-4 beta-propeller domain-containing protein n=1 Tax=Dipteronia dyeriana TaxID=168575 RepID=A0AAE0CM21_9ROSI|nr:hypothetical protein Ddye_009222 [Dipteronia dyeriana]